MIINRYIIAYFLFSVLGWVWESIYCTAKEKKWQNRGFLYGPLCPIYGAGAIIGLIYWDLNDHGIIPDLSWIGVFIAGFIVSMILEYPTSYILEKKFNARWWDYTTVPLNINGRTSVPTSIGFGLGAIAIVEFIIPPFDGFYDKIPLFLIALLPVIFVAIYSCDITLTVSHLTNFQRNVAELEESFQNRMTERVDNLFEKHGRVYGNTLSRIASFRMSESRNGIAEKIVEARRELRKPKTNIESK